MVPPKTPTQNFAFIPLYEVVSWPEANSMVNPSLRQGFRDVSSLSLGSLSIGWSPAMTAAAVVAGAEAAWGVEFQVAVVGTPMVPGVVARVVGVVADPVVVVAVAAVQLDQVVLGLSERRECSRIRRYACDVRGWIWLQGVKGFHPWCRVTAVAGWTVLARERLENTTKK